MTRYARNERQALIDTLVAAGPDAPTLCEGWTTRDLVAHMLIREREPVAGLGVIVKPLAGLTKSRQESIAKRDYAKLIEQLRRPPVWSPLSNPLTDEVINPLEMYIHHEDVRRARPGWKARAIDPGLSEKLWGRVRGTGRLSLRKFPAAVVIEWPGHGRVSAGAGGPEVTLTGEPSELVLFLTGRQAHADVALTGPDELTGRLRSARLGI
ncbi:TIGR03085 family protein [Virgisporangium aliadipatigenens]|uniref:TIGR03085 family protein n=1 Tax=Virgisporangium aliadipatigenens TaxID=741659 RepID=A0A8J4DV53_9ACTN|nr:TIGR03085 family metal-binding protein [Virgisporangium aliadipatigenens]GIJ52015.1 TIGR03085 family protein [Virgisporangium aliadipatigenens]